MRRSNCRNKPLTVRVATAVIVCVSLLVGGGCAHYPVNPRLDHYDAAAGYRFETCTTPTTAPAAPTSPTSPTSPTTTPAHDPDDVFIVLCFSGGGTRAAALAYGVLEELHETRDPRDPNRASLLDEVDVISSVSGGSFTAAYYALFRDRIFCDFAPRFLYRDVQLGLLLSVLNPINQWRLASPWFSRIDLAAEYYDRNIFDRKTFADLIALHRRPFLMLNSTDMSLGCRFEFTQDQFDLLYSDLSRVAVGRAVAASSAFPVLLAPLTIDNYPKPDDLRPPLWVDGAHNDRERSPRRYAHARQVDSWWNAAAKPFVHLIDGGIADNIGLRGIWQRIQFLDANSPGDLNILRMVNNERIHKLVVIVVDAKPGESDARDRRNTTPGVIDVIGNISTVPMENYSFDTLQLLPQTMQIQRLMAGQNPDLAWTRLQTYFVQINFDGVKDPQERAYLQGLGTNYHLPREAVDRLRRASREQLRGAKDFKRLLDVLGGAPYTTTVPPPPPPPAAAPATTRTTGAIPTTSVP